MKSSVVLFRLAHPHKYLKELINMGDCGLSSLSAARFNANPKVSLLDNVMGMDERALRTCGVRDDVRLEVSQMPKKKEYSNKLI